MTIRSHDQYNTTIYGLDDRYRGIKNERRILFLNERDMQRLNLSEDDLVDLESAWGDDRERIAPRFKVKPYNIPAGCAASYFPETNVLVSIDSVADRSNTPTSKFVPIRIRMASGAPKSGQEAVENGFEYNGR